MKSNFSHFLGLTVLLLIMATFSANAQEGVPNNEIPDVNFRTETVEEKEKLLMNEPATPNGEKSIQNREQLLASPKSGKSKSIDGSKNPNSKPEEDALSFNFLYYIIQKFKISDIVEQ